MNADPVKDDYYNRKNVYCGAGILPALYSVQASSLLHIPCRLEARTTKRLFLTIRHDLHLKRKQPGVRAPGYR